jgi:trehalose 6-phosphate phosphatase
MKLCTESDLLEIAVEAHRLWLFLDYDGTLDDFAPTPDEILPNDRVIDLLERLKEAPAVRLAVVSGRRLAHIEELLPIPGVLLAGTYGLEMRTPEGELRLRVREEEVRPTLARLKPRWSELIAGYEGFYLEDKGWTLAIHARFASDEDAAEVLEEARKLVATFDESDLFQIVGGHKFLEISPRLAHKGRTVEHLLESYPWPEALLLYLGDDDKDEEAFDVIHAHGGKALLVSPEPRLSPADCRLPSPQAVWAWLEALVDRRHQRHGGQS